MRRTAPLILGAGPAGCAAAIALAQSGAAPVLIDRSADVADALCGGFLSWRTADRLRHMGVDPERLGAHRVTSLHLFAGLRHAELALPTPSFGLSRRALDGALRLQAIACGARLEIDTAREIDGCTVVGRSRRWSGDGLFLATGKHDVRGSRRPRSSLDPAMGLRIRLPASAERTRVLAGRIELHMFAGGYAGIVLQEDRTANVCLAVRKSRLTASGGDIAELLDRLAGENPALGQRLGSDWRNAYPDGIGAVPYGFTARDTAPGLFRLGDQAAVIPSLAGEGMAIAIASGALAADRWLAQGPQAAPAFQRELARRTAVPVRTARVAWRLAEHPVPAAIGTALAGRVPILLRWLMEATRLDAPASLAQVPAAP